jgi:hypothetical protein
VPLVRGSARVLPWPGSPKTSVDLGVDPYLYVVARQGGVSLLSGLEVEDYHNVLCRAVPSGGAVILATFAPEGPERCSGFPVSRYDSTELGGAGAGFEMVAEWREVHLAPGGNTQPFTWIDARRTQASSRPPTQRGRC